MRAAMTIDGYVLLVTGVLGAVLILAASCAMH
jgi:hypothetical protein